MPKLEIISKSFVKLWTCVFIWSTALVLLSYFPLDWSKCPPKLRPACGPAGLTCIPAHGFLASQRGGSVVHPFKDPWGTEKCRPTSQSPGLELTLKVPSIFMVLLSLHGKSPHTLKTYLSSPCRTPCSSIYVIPSDKGSLFTSSCTGKSGSINHIINRTL